MATSNGTEPLGDIDNEALLAASSDFRDDLVGILAESIFWSAYFILFCFALRIQWRNATRSGPSLVILIVTCYLFLSSSGLLAMNFAVCYLRIRIFFERTELPLAERMDAVDDKIFVFGLPMETLFLANMIVGDSVVIWRAWVLWRGDKWRKLVFIPIFMLVASFILSVLAMVCLAADSFSVRSSIPAGSRMCQWGEPAAWAVSLLTNVTSTSLIAAKAWHHRQFLRQAPHQNGRSRSEKILVILVESGFIYCIFWMSQLILFLNYDSAGYIYTWEVLGGMGDQISGVYPTAIIVLVSMQRSMSSKSFSSFDIDSSPKDSAAQELTTIQFSSGTDKSGSPRKAPGFLTTSINTESFFERSEHLEEEEEFEGNTRYRP